MSLDWLLAPQLVAFRDAGYDVITMSAPGPDTVAVADLGFPHVAVADLTRAVSPWRDGRALAALERRFRDLRPDIVHTHNPKPGVLGRVAARRAGVGVVVNTVHGLYATPDDRWRRRVAVYGIERLATMFSDAELVQNPEDLEVLRRLGVPESRLVLLGNGVDLGRFDPDTVSRSSRRRLRAEWGVDDTTTVVGVVGRLVWEKGYREVFAAARLLAGSDCRFVVVGPDEPGKPGAVDAGAVAAARGDGVVFTGARNDMPEIYGALDMCVLASYREGFPRAAMEASAMGLPVVASDVRGCRQAVIDGVTGRLFPPRLAHRLAEAVEGLVADPDTRRRMGGAARTLARAEFDDRRVIDITLSTYERLLADRTRRFSASV